MWTVTDLLCNGYRSGVVGERCAYLLGVESTEVTEVFDSNRLLFRFSHGSLLHAGY